MPITGSYWDRVEASVDASASILNTQKTAVKPGFVAPEAPFALSDSSSFNYPSQILNTLTPSSPLPTDDDYSRGYMIRYLFRQSNNLQDPVKETDADGFASIQGYYLYKSTQTKWKITGDVNSATTINLNIAELADKDLPGSKFVLARNPLQYWKDIPDNASQFDITENLKNSQTVPEISSPGISSIPFIRRELDTESGLDLLTQAYEDIIVEDNTTI